MRLFPSNLISIIRSWDGSVQLYLFSLYWPRLLESYTPSWQDLSRYPTSCWYIFERKKIVWTEERLDNLPITTPSALTRSLSPNRITLSASKYVITEGSDINKVWLSILFQQVDRSILFMYLFFIGSVSLMIHRRKKVTQRWKQESHGRNGTMTNHFISLCRHLRSSWHTMILILYNHWLFIRFMKFISRAFSLKSE